MKNLLNLSLNKAVVAFFIFVILMLLGLAFIL